MEDILEILNKSNGFKSDVFLQLCEDTDFPTAFQILQRFNDNLKQGVTSSTEALKTSNAEMAWKACHKIAGSAELLGFVQFGRHSRDLSYQIKANPNTTSFLNELTAYCAEMEALIQLINQCDIKQNATAF